MAKGCAYAFGDGEVCKIKHSKEEEKAMIDQKLHTLCCLPCPCGCGNRILAIKLSDASALQLAREKARENLKLAP